MALSPTSSHGASSSGGVGATLYDFTIAGADQASIDTNVDGVTVANFAGYTLLEFVVIGRTDDAGATATATVILNNDSGASYDLSRLTNTDSAVSGGTAVAQSNMAFPIHGTGGAASYAVSNRWSIPGYAGTVFFKQILAQLALLDSTAANVTVENRSYAFRSTAAITRIKVAASGAAKLKIGSRLIVYGR